MKRVVLYMGFGVIFLGLLTFATRVKAQGFLPANNFTSNNARNTKALPAKSVVETISTSGRSQLTELIMKAGLVAHLSGKSEFTFFAPAPEMIPQLQQMPPEKLHGLLLNHLVAGKYLSDDFREGTQLKTMGGSTITIIRKRDLLLINGVAIASANEKASNGIIHTLTGYLQ